ncbi:unnamed protein product [Phytophthora lilii]|uniref:Unnamed protein product n=1 Tax=Phytophthora lilii TaxID=2077276 RepID=A0A9W6X6V9_9STRA|nr:unnamed protein product [Phytophthora lilii]
MEALGYFSEDVTTSAQVENDQVAVDIAAPSKPNVVGEDIESMLLSLEIQELLSSDEHDKIMPMPQNVGKTASASGSPDDHHGKQSPPKKIDGRLKPYSTCKRRNRKRPKHELEYLRAKVVELQEELAALNKCEVGSPSAVKMEHQTTTGEGFLHLVDPQQTALVPGNFSSWKDIAYRQKHEVDKSIDENRKLRNRLLGQLQVARVLEAAIEQHQKKAQGLRTSRPFAMSLSDEQIFAQLNTILESQFVEVDKVLTTKGLSNVFHNLQGGIEFKREANGISFRHEEARLLPYSQQAFHSAIWNSLHCGLVVKDTTTQVLNTNRSNLIFRDNLMLPKAHRVSVTKKSAFQRYIKHDQVVFVWNSYVEIDGSVSVRIHEKGWSIASPFEFHRGVVQGANSSDNSVRGCMARMAIQLTPEVPEFKSEQEAQMHVGEMTDLIVGTYHHNFGLVHEVAERLLLSNRDAATIESSSTQGYIQV